MTYVRPGLHHYLGGRARRGRGIKGCGRHGDAPADLTGVTSRVQIISRAKHVRGMRPECRSSSALLGCTTESKSGREPETKIGTDMENGMQYESTTGPGRGLTVSLRDFSDGNSPTAARPTAAEAHLTVT
ncbi:hypothetical protein EVAR_48436_1 [Eumeta japonica]|uniref:Uncharacterized protein n=1 Tax=Eumeta variegata TaxID=151549 RepID=A0A4C1XRQ4_EUMVA|nr:hypothetical protein EVAR_48436_1 [Eumeta japonica]